MSVAKYKVVIDESGEAGIAKIRTANSGGASPYLTLGACIYPTEHEGGLISELERIKRLFNKNDLHCSTLSHFQKLRYVREIKGGKFIAFGTISNKATLGGYRSAISDSSKMYYNKCAQYLLEQIGSFIKQYGIEPNHVEIIFEEGNFDYESLKNLIAKCQKNPMHENTKLLRYIKTDSIKSAPKKQLQTLCLADLVAHTLYKCVDKSEKDYLIPEYRYFQELSSKFHADKISKKILGAGLKCIHNINKLNLDSDVIEIIKNLRSDTHHQKS